MDLLRLPRSGASDTILASGNATVQGAVTGDEVLQFASYSECCGQRGAFGRPERHIHRRLGQSTMTGGGGINLYEFNSSSPGGTAVINNFVQSSDQLQLNGYNIATVLASDITQSGGNTYINLGGGTTIELKGFTGTCIRAISSHNNTNLGCPNAPSVGTSRELPGSLVLARLDPTGYSGFSALLTEVFRVRPPNRAPPANHSLQTRTQEGSLRLG